MGTGRLIAGKQASFFHHEGSTRTTKGHEAGKYRASRQARFGGLVRAVISIPL
jgi:hypothetical protein